MYTWGFFNRFNIFVSDVPMRIVWNINDIGLSPSFSLSTAVYA